MKIIPLSEGSFTIDKSKLFVPFDKDRDELQARATGSLLVEVQPFVVITAKDVLLLDAGLGFTEEGTLQVHRNLRLAGIEPSRVTKVLLSHLHKDHAGGAGIEDRLSSFKELSFPGAIYYIQRRELDFAFEKGFPSYMPHELEILKEAEQVVFLDADAGQIDDYIRYEITGAHCPYHQVFRIYEGNEIVFFGADDAPQLGQMKHRFVAKYDYDGKKAADLRTQWWQQGREERWTFLFYHDIKTPVFKQEN